MNSHGGVLKKLRDSNTSPIHPYLLLPDMVDDLDEHFKNKGFQPTRMVLCRLELTLLNMSLPTMVAMVGNTSAPHRIRVADT